MMADSDRSHAVRTPTMDGFAPDYRLVPCARDGCREVFEPRTPEHLYHRESCRKRAHRERKARQIEETIIEAVRGAVRTHI